MSRRLLPLLLLALLAPAAAGCGGDERDGDSRAEQAQAAQAYATQVASVTGTTDAKLAELATSATYDDGQAAARATSEYAAAIDAAAAQLFAVTPPAGLRATHDQLAALYRETAAALGALSRRFGGAGDDQAAVTALAQELAAETQRYATRETQLREQLDAALTQLAGTSPAIAATTPPAR